MANIKIVVNGPLMDGHKLTFKAPCDCISVEKLKVCYVENATQKNRLFTMKDAHGNDLTGLGNLFSQGAYVDVVLDTVNGFAYLQNAGTNKYLEQKLTPVDNLESDRSDLPLSARMGSELNKKLPKRVVVSSIVDIFASLPNNSVAYGYSWAPASDAHSDDTKGCYHLYTFITTDGGMYNRVIVDAADGIFVGSYRPDNKDIYWWENNDINNKYTFSTSEKQIGTWINGKKLYRKTIDFGALPNTTIKAVAHNVSGYSEIWVDESHSYVIGTENRFFPVNYPSSSGTAYAWECYIKGSTIEIKTNSNRTSFSAIVTLLYTK